MVNPEALGKLCGGACRWRVLADPAGFEGSVAQSTDDESSADRGPLATMGNSAPETTVVYAHKPRQH